MQSITANNFTSSGDFHTLAELSHFFAYLLEMKLRDCMACLRLRFFQLDILELWQISDSRIVPPNISMFRPFSITNYNRGIAGLQ